MCSNDIGKYFNDVQKKKNYFIIIEFIKIYVYKTILQSFFLRFWSLMSLPVIKNYS